MGLGFISSQLFCQSVSVGAMQHWGVAVNVMGVMDVTLPHLISGAIKHFDSICAPAVELLIIALKAGADSQNWK